MGAAAMAVAALVVTRYPLVSYQVLKALSTPRTESTKEGQKANDDLFSRGSVSGVHGESSQKSDRKDDQNKADVGNKGAAADSVLCSLRLVCLRVPPRMYQWFEFLDNWRECRDDFFVVGMDGFRFVVKNTRVGRVVGLARVHWYSRKANQSTGAVA